MVSDLEGSVYKIGEFLGGCAKEMVNEPGLLKHVASESSVEAMRENQERWFPETLL
jgi:hypothetical protein